MPKGSICCYEHKECFKKKKKALIMGAAVFFFCLFVLFCFFVCFLILNEIVNVNHEET